MVDEELSAEDLREKLFHTFRNRGVLDSLKSQLRNRLVTELQQTTKVNLSNSKKKLTDESSLFYHAANSLVADHLERCNFEYTLSVFLPESGSSRDKLMTNRDLLHLLKVDKDSQLFKSLEGSFSSKINPKSFLWEIISQQLSQCGQTKQKTTSVQTEESASLKSPSIAEKLQFVDQTFSKRAERENESWGSQAEQKIAEIQRKCEERKKAELEAEIKQYKASALASMRLEEKERCQREIKLAKEQMEKDYSLKAEMLRLKEKELADLQHRQQKIHEENAYSQRQNIIQEMQAVKDREIEFKTRQELHLKKIQLEEDRLKNEAEKIKTRELVLIDEQKRVQQKIEDEIQRYKLQHQENYQKRIQDLELREAQLKQDKESLERDKSTYLGYYDELEGKKEQLRQLQNQFETSKYNIATLQQQKDSLLQKLDEVKDYRRLKDNEQKLQKEKDEIQSRLEEQSNNDKVNKETIKDLKDKLTKPSAELVLVRNELKAVKDDARLKEKLLKDKQRRFEARLQQEGQRCAEYQRLYEEHLLRQKEMEHELDDLRAALHHTQTVLRMELERKRMSEASVSDINDLTLLSPVEPTLKTSYAFAPRANQQDPEPDSFMNDTTNTQELIANTKDVFDKLEKKAKDFEESYRRFQSRMKNKGLDQFTSLPPVSLDRQTLQGYSGRHAEIIDPHPSLGIDTNIDKADEFVPLSWMPVTEKSAAKMPESRIADDHAGGSLEPSHFPSSLLPSTRQGNSTESLTRFYSLPSFGLSEVAQNSSAPRYFGLSRTDRRPPNNTVNVSDLIAKPGSPSVISAPIDHSPMDNNTADSGKGKKAKDRHGDSSTDTMRRPLSSTIDRVREGTGMGSRENDFLTSASSQRNSDQNSHVPVIDGSVFYGRKSDIDKDSSEQDSHHSSDASLSGGYLTMGTLNKPSRTRYDTRKTTKVKDSTNEKENDEADAYNPPPSTRISLDDAWGGDGDQVGTASSKEKDEESSLSINSNPSLPSNGEKVSVPLDSVWKDTEVKRAQEQKQREQREREERELREREEHEWEEEKRRREEQRRQREQEAWEREQRELEELQREQELREREKDADRRPVQTEARTDEDKKEAQEQKENESSKDPEIDPVMLQYMQMIQRKKEEEDKARTVEPTKKESKEVVDTGSNSLLSQGDNLGSIEELTDDDGFDWG